ncbi:MAG TPA: peptidylprolyl isomerase [Syntrophorhabdales bacterium]|nr:peptidylprolyl isomerase [Syntrophorhabdales bacterium]
MQITKDKAVTVEYTLKNEAGEVLDTSRNRAALTYVQGTGNMIQGFENALEGKQAGDKFSFDVAPADGYGERDNSLLFSVAKDKFQGVPDLEVGMRFQVQTPNGAMIMAVDRVEGDSVVLDGNHPLAGNKLSFDVEVMGVRDATDEELMEAHSPSHGCGCSCDDTSHEESGCGGSSCGGCH